MNPSSLCIPDLPPHLRVVPPSPSGPDDPGLEAWRLDYAAWKAGILAYRRQVWRLCGERVEGATGQP